MNLYRICGMANPVVLKRFQEPTQQIFRDALTDLDYFNATEVRDMIFEFDFYAQLVRACGDIRRSNGKIEALLASTCASTA